MSQPARARSRVIFHKRVVTPKTARHFKGAWERLVRFTQNNRGQKYPVLTSHRADIFARINPRLVAEVSHGYALKYDACASNCSGFRGAFKHARHGIVYCWALRRVFRVSRPTRDAHAAQCAIEYITPVMVMISTHIALSRCTVKPRHSSRVIHVTTL